MLTLYNWLEGSCKTQKMTKTISITGLITEETIRHLIDDLNQIKNKKTNMRIFISSNGGDPYYTMGAYDLIRSLPNYVTTIGTGSVCSAAVLILQAGDKRLITPNTTIMIHDVRMEITSEVKYNEMKYEVIEMKRMRKLFIDLLAQKLKIEKRKIVAMIMQSKDTYFNVKDAIEAGIVDGVYNG